MAETKESLVTSIQEMLNEEKWTRATISNYSKNNFIELAQIIEKTCNLNCIDEVNARSYSIKCISVDELII